MNPKDHSMKLWCRYVNATTDKERAEALFQMQEHRRRSAAGLPVEVMDDEIDKQTNAIIDTFDGAKQ